MASRLAFRTLSAFALLVSVLADGLSLKVTGPAQVDDISDLHLKTTLKNTGTSTLTLINDPWSMLSTSATDKFTITHESGANAHFAGMTGLYTHDMALKNGDTTTLKPGQSIEATHSVADAYDFTNSGAGAYEISPSTLFYVVSEAGNFEAMHANLESSHKVAISGSGKLAVPRPPSLHKEGSTSANFPGCNANQINLLNTAIPIARSYVEDAFQYMSRLVPNTASQRYNTWFGPNVPANDSERAVYDHFNNLRNTAGAFTQWTYDCACTGCDRRFSACVFPDQYPVIHLCPSYWTAAPLRATSTSEWSQSGLLVHEATHLTRMAGTQDHAYMRNACLKLARNNPNLAVFNADSHMFFAENNPRLA